MYLVYSLITKQPRLSESPQCEDGEFLIVEADRSDLEELVYYVGDDDYFYIDCIGEIRRSGRIGKTLSDDEIAEALDRFDRYKFNIWLTRCIQESEDKLSRRLQ